MDRAAPHKLPGFDQCIVGLSERPGEDQIVAYDLEKVLRVLGHRNRVDRTVAIKQLDDLLEGVAPELMPTFVSYADAKQIDEIYGQHKIPV